MNHEFCLNEVFETTCKNCGIPEDSPVSDKPCGTCPDCWGNGSTIRNGYRNQAPGTIGFVVEHVPCRKCRGHGDLNKMKEEQKRIADTLRDELGGCS